MQAIYKSYHTRFSFSPQGKVTAHSPRLEGAFPAKATTETGFSKPEQLSLIFSLYLNIILVRRCTGSTAPLLFLQEKPVPHECTNIPKNVFHVWCINVKREQKPTSLGSGPQEYPATTTNNKKYWIREQAQPRLKAEIFN